MGPEIQKNTLGAKSLSTNRARIPYRNSSIKFTRKVYSGNALYVKKNSPYLGEIIRHPFGDPSKGHPIFTCQTLIKRLKSTFSYLMQQRN